MSEERDILQSEGEGMTPSDPVLVRREIARELMEWCGFVVKVAELGLLGHDKLMTILHAHNEQILPRMHQLRNDAFYSWAGMTTLDDVRGYVKWAENMIADLRRVWGGMI